MGRPPGVQVTGPLATYSDGFHLELTRRGSRPTRRARNCS